MKGRLVQYTGGLALLLILLMTAGCNRRSAVDEKMDLADGLMTSRPDSDLVVLEDIPASDINGDYYIEHGTPDEQLRTYYCQGRIYQNKGDDDMAMQCFILGKEHCKGISDTLTLANLMVAQASIQYSIYKYKQQS